jgi:hypothetical protein
MKKTTTHKIKHSLLLLYIIVVITMSIIFRNDFAELDLEPKYVTYFFIGCLFIALIMIFSISIAEILKSKETIKKEEVNRIENRIKYHKK